MQRNYLYLVVTDYPYGVGEPFLEDELFVISAMFEEVYLIIPQIQLVDVSQIRYKLPENCRLIPLQSEVKRKHQFYALMRLFNPSVWLEFQHISGRYGQKISLTHLRQILGFIAAGKALSDQIEMLISEQGHQKRNITIYSYWCSFSAAGLSILKEKYPQLKTVIRMHGWDCFFFRNALNYLPMRPWIIKLNDHVCTVSEMGRQHLIGKINPEISNKLKVSYLGTVCTDVPMDSKYETGVLRILSIAFLQPVKRIDWLIRAISSIENVRVSWTHMGSWTAKEQPIRDLADTLLGPKINVDFQFTGEVSLNEVKAFMHERKADFLVCSSSSEGLPVSMMEAMSYGMPVLSTNAGGIAELVEHRKNGMLTPVSDDIKPFVAMLKEASALSLVDYERYSKEARNVFETQFSGFENYREFGSKYLL